MTAFLNRNVRRNAATIEVAERSESPLVALRLDLSQKGQPCRREIFVFARIQCATCKKRYNGI